MARLSDDRINRIKRDVSVLNWIESEGFTLKKEGRDYVMACVFHQDKTPSLKITPHKNLYHCFGCGAAGSIIDWIMHRQGLDFRAAVEHIEQKQGLTVQPKLETSSALSSSLAATISCDDKQTALQGAVDYYHQSLKNSAEALAYLESRGLNDAELINTFTLGASDKTLTSSLAAKHTQAGKQQRHALQDCCILKKTGYEHFAACLVVPVFDQGQCVEIYGRRLQPYSDPKHLYLPGPHAGVWNAAGLNNTDTVILCEALIDAMTFWVHGFRHVTASYGTKGFTDEHLQCFKQKNITKILIAYDRDTAGNEAAQALAEKLAPENIHCYRVNLPKGMDVNDYALTMSPAAKALQLVVDKAEPMLNAPVLDAQKTVSKKQELDINVTAHIAEENTTEKNAKQVLASPLTITETDITFSCAQRHYRVRGLHNNTRLDQLKINLLCKIHDESHYVDHLDLYQAKARKHYITSAGEELGLESEVIKKDLGALMLALETHQEQQFNGQKNLNKNTKTELTEAQKKHALELLNDKHLVRRIVQDINTLGVIGEDSNVLVSYLACVSRKLEKPLAVMIQSTSAAGKSALMDSVLDLMPEEHHHKFAAMTGQSLYYMGEMNLKHSILAIAEEEGAHTASYALKLLQSEGEVSIASTGKNEDTGDLETKTYQVEGPVMLMMTTTAIDIDEELMNRCLVLSVNESREQTQAIHAIQRKKRTLEGLTQKAKKQSLVDQHHAAQRLLKSLAVINPYAEHLTFLSDKTRTRRDHEKYLTLIDSIALLHQYQREIKTLDNPSTGDAIEYIEVTLEDIETANQLAHEVLGRSLDELPPQTRKLLDLISTLVKEACKKENMEQRDYRFSRKEIRDYTGWGNTQIRIHCDRLVDMEYLVVHRGKRGSSFVYELLYQAPNNPNQKMLMNLLDIDTLKNCHVSKSSRGSSPQLAGPKRPQNGGLTGAKRGEQNADSPRPRPRPPRVNGQELEIDTETHVLASKKTIHANGSIEGVPV
jgi:DNA primase